MIRTYKRVQDSCLHRNSTTNYAGDTVCPDCHKVLDKKLDKSIYVVNKVNKGMLDARIPQGTITQSD